MSDEQTTTEPTRPRPAEADLYDLLAEEIGPTFQDTRGGFTFDYLTGEQVTTHLNETLGFLNWSFRVLEHGIHAEADECWVLGELTVTIGDRTVTRQQFGSQKVKRSRASGTPLDIGFDLKGAATDGLKKAASLIGIGLWLWKKNPPVTLGNAPVPRNDWGDSGPRAMPSSGPGDSSTGATSNDTDALYCENDGQQLTETRFKDNTVWSPSQLATFGRRKHSRILCMSCYREANNAKRRAEEGAAF